MAYITKNIFLNSDKCMRMAYFMLRDREDYLQEELSEYEEHIIDQGNLIGEKARGLFTDRAVMISKTNGDAAARLLPPGHAGDGGAARKADACGLNLRHYLKIKKLNRSINKRFNSISSRFIFNFLKRPV